MIDYFKTKSKINDFKNAKQYWKFYSSSIQVKSSKASNADPINLMRNGVTINDPIDIADTFNTFFTTIDCNTLLEHNICLEKINENFNFLKSSKLIATGCFEFECVSVSLVKKLITNLDSSSSPGCTNIQIKILKNLEEIAINLTKMINKCILSNTIPEDWKTALVSPLFKKKGNDHEVNNYRGISVISPFGKILEKVLATQIIEYLNEYNILI